MSTYGPNDEKVERAVRDLLIEVAPERREEIEEFWNEYDLQLYMREEIAEKDTFILEAGRYREIRFNHRVMRAFWLASFIAWEGYRSIHSWLTTEVGDFRRFNDMIAAFYRILSAEDSALVPMPAGIPDPGNYAQSEEHRAAGELATFAVGWAFLHEVRHIRHQREGTSSPVPGDGPPEPRRDEELSCDQFATQFMLERADDFAATSGRDAKLVRRKRELGIYFAMFAITLVQAGNWDHSDTHPSVQTRINAVISQMQGDGTRMSDAIAHVAFGALWSRWPEAPGPFKS